MGMTLEAKIANVSDALLKLLKDGTSPWQKDWQLQASSFCNAATGKPYVGQNVILLMIESLIRGYTSRLFIGFAQAQDLGLKMFKGSKSCFILYPRLVKKKDEETGEEEAVIIGWSWANVFNLDCFEDNPAKQAILQKFSDQDAQKPRLAPPDFVLSLIDSHRPNIVFDPSRTPSYSPTLDRITMPPIDCFHSAEGYAATFIHELAHWTGHHTRLNRSQIGFSQSSVSYAYEELVAEMTSAILCAEAQIPYSLENHASYIASWIKLLQEDSSAFTKALKDASKASHFLIPANNIQS